MSSSVCSLSSKGEGKPPPHMSEGSEEAEELGGSEACPLYGCHWQVLGRGAEVPGGTEPSPGPRSQSHHLK